MENFVLFLLILTTASCTRVPYTQNSSTNLIPQPVEIQQSGCSFVLTKASTIGFDNQVSRKIAEILAQKLNVPTGFSIKAEQGNNGAIQFNLNKVPVAQIGKEGYTLVSTRKGVVITANEPAGLFYGMQTLLQLLPGEIESKTAINTNWTIPGVKITDYPRFAWRGIMLDVSRIFFSKEDVKLYIDQIARFKFNTFHWHLTDDNGWRIEIRSLPKLTEVAALFPNPYIHVGGDECYKAYWTKDTGCQALMKKLNITKVEDLQGYFINRVEGILKTKGKKLLGWDEILEGGISPGATVMSWRGIKGGIEAAKLRHDVVMTPTTFAYLDYQQGDQTIEPLIYADYCKLRLKKCYSFDPVPDSVEAKYILGDQGNLWTEQIPTLRHAEYMTWPRGWALAEVFWSPKESKNWTDFVMRVEKQFARAGLAEINHSLAIYDPIINIGTKDGKLIVEMETEMPGLDIFYTIGDTMPDSYSTKYTKQVDLPDGAITLRVITYRNGKPIGHLITLNPEDLKRRING